MHIAVVEANKNANIYPISPITAPRCFVWGCSIAINLGCDLAMCSAYCFCGGAFSLIHTHSAHEIICNWKEVPFPNLVTAGMTDSGHIKGTIVVPHMPSIHRASEPVRLTHVTEECLSCVHKPWSCSICSVGDKSIKNKYSTLEQTPERVLPVLRLSTSSLTLPFAMPREAKMNGS